MKHFLLFVVAIFVGLFLVVLNRQQNVLNDEKPVLRVYAYSSFTGKWGPGQVLKEMFEKECNCSVEYAEGSDSGILLQRLKIEGESLGADLVIGLDQFDLQKALVGLKWQRLNLGAMDWEDQVKPALANNYFVPYDWGALTFMGKKGGFSPHRLDDLTASEFHRKILLEDPRTSSPGFQFVYWVVKSKGEEAGYQFIEQLLGQVSSVSPSWSSAMGLFNKDPGQLVFSYVTSPLYYQIEENKNEFAAYDFEEPLPLQVEFLAIPDFCRRCELSEKFVNLLLSAEGQKILMQKNYMMPVLKGVKDGTPFADVTHGRKFLDFEIPAEDRVNSMIKKWGEIRREHGT
jgi:thiamine transport system substrate-binding protein